MKQLRYSDMYKARASILNGQKLNKTALSRGRVFYFINDEMANRFVDILIERAKCNNGRVSLFYALRDDLAIINNSATGLEVPYICSWFGWEREDIETKARVRLGKFSHGYELKLPKLKVYAESLDGLEIDHSKFESP